MLAGAWVACADGDGSAGRAVSLAILVHEADWVRAAGKRRIRYSTRQPGANMGNAQTTSHGGKRIFHPARYLVRTGRQCNRWRPATRALARLLRLKADRQRR